MTMTNWIKHNSTEPPALAPAALVEIMEPLTEYVVVRWASDPLVRSGLPFRPVTDPECIPYCSAEGLEPWAEYVSTDDDGRAIQFRFRPTKALELAGFWASIYHWLKAPDTHRHPGDWNDSLMRVWRGDQ